MHLTNAKSSQNLIDFLLGNPDVEEAQKHFENEAHVTHAHLAEENGVRSVAANTEAVLYITKGKVAICELRPEDGDGEITKNTFLLGAGEPFYKASGNTVFLYACKGECDLVEFHFAGQPAPQVEEDAAGHADLMLKFQQAAVELDDYYFGYDERYAKVYEAGADLWESDKPNESLLNVLNKHRELFTGKIIDLGCGEGRDTIYLASQGFDITGVDVSRAALNKARERAQRLHVNGVTFVETNVIYLRLMKDNFYDFAMNMGCLHMITDQEQRSQHIQRVFEILKPGGYFLIDHCQENWGKGFYSIPDYEKVAKDLVPGKSIPRRIRVEQGETEIDLKVLPFAEKYEKDLINEITAYGFHVVDVNRSDTEAFGSSAVLLFQKPL